jgi:hypothetical protein
MLSADLVVSFHFPFMSAFDRKFHTRTAIPVKLAGQKARLPAKQLIKDESAAFVPTSTADSAGIRPAIMQ